MQRSPHPAIRAFRSPLPPSARASAARGACATAAWALVATAVALPACHSTSPSDPARGAERAAAAQTPVTKTKSVTATATIQAIDAANRTVTIRDQTGVPRNPWGTDWREPAAGTGIDRVRAD